MESGVATEPWRAPGVPSCCSSVSLDQLCNWHNSYEVSTRFLASNEYGSPFATPLSSVQQLDNLVDELNEEVVASALQGPSRRSQVFVRSSTCGNDDLSHVLRVSVDAGNAAGIAAPCGRPCAPLVRNVKADWDLQADDNGSSVRAIDSAALQAFLCDGRSDISQAPRQPQPQLPLQPQPHPRAHDQHTGRCDAPPPPLQQQPEAVPCQPAAVSACDVPGPIRDVFPGLHVHAPTRTLPAAAGIAALAAPSTPRCADGKGAATDSPTVGGGMGNFGQPLPGGMLSSLRKAASDVVSQLRALGSGRGSRTGSRNDTGAATPAAISSLRQSIDNATSHAVLGGGIAAGPGANTPAGAVVVETADGGPFRTAGGGGGGGLAGGGLQQGATRAAPPRRPRPGSSTTRLLPPLLPKDTSSGRGSSSLGESLAVPCFWLTGARSSSTMWPNGFQDERQGSADLLPDMWDLARVLDEVDDGFPVPVQVTKEATGRALGGAHPVTASGAFCTAPRVYGGAIAAASDPALARTDPVLLLSSCDMEEGRRHGLVSPLPSQPKRPMVGSAPTSLASPLGGLGWPPVSLAAGGSVGAVSTTNLRGHDVEQLYVLSELVQQARASEGAELGRSRGGVELRQLRVDPQGPRGEGATESVLGQEPASHHHATAPHDPTNPGLELGSADFPCTTCSRASAPMAAAPSMEAHDVGSAAGVCSSRGRVVLGKIAQLPFFGNAAAGRLTSSDPLYTSAPPRLAVASTAPYSCSPGGMQQEAPWTSFYSVAPASTAPESSTSAAQWAATAPPGPVGAASSTGRHAVHGLGMYGMHGMSSGTFGSTNSLAALETGPELSMFWPLVMPTPVPAVLAGDVEAAKRAAGSFLLNVLVSCSCGCGSALGCSAAANSGNGNIAGRVPRAGADPRAVDDSNPRLPGMTKLGTTTNGSAIVQPSPAPSLPRTSINAMLSGVELAKVELPRGGGQTSMLRLPLLPAMQLVNVFASSGADIGPASTLLAVPPAMADELQDMFADKVEASVASLMDHVHGDAPLGYDSRRRCDGATGASSAAAGVAGIRTTALQAQVRRDLAALRAPSSAAPPWAMSVPVWAACRREWQSTMQPLLHDICYLLLCVPNCFPHGLVKWDRVMYCETLARLLAQLERHKLWQTLSALLVFCARQGVALLYQGEALGAGSLSADRLRVLLEGALHDEITIKAIGDGGGDQGGIPRPLLGSDGEACWARASALGSGGSSGPIAVRGRRASLSALMAPDAADAATVATLQAWRRSSLDGPTDVRDTAAAGNVYDTAAAAVAAGAGAGARRSRAGAAAAVLGHADLGVHAGAGAALAGAGLRASPDSGRLRSQASIGRVLSRVLSVMAGGRDDTGSPAGGHAAAAADAGPGLTAGRNASVGGEAADAAGTARGGQGGAAATAAAAPTGQRLGHVIENTAVVLAFAGVMLQSLL